MKVSLIVLPIMSISLSFFTLPVEFAVFISILFAILPVALDRFIFEYKVFHIMPMPTEEMLIHRLGSTWFTDDVETMEGLGFMVMFKYKEVAKDAFNMLKAWNFGKVIDSSANITFRAVREGSGKYSIYLYPGDRFDIVRSSERHAKKELGEKSETSMIVAKFHMQFCFDYLDDELKIKCIESMPLVSELLLNIGYVENGEIKAYSKRGFRLRDFSIKDRNDSTLGEIEQSMEWSNPDGKLSEINQALVEKVNKKLETST